MAEGKILIVDDEASIRRTLSMILKYEGYLTIEAEDGIQCLKMIEDEMPEIVLLDILMPRKDGLEVLAEVQKMESPPVVIMISGHGTIETAVKATKMGAFDFLEKPLERERVLLSVRNALKSRRLIRENIELRLKYDRDYQLIGKSKAIIEVREAILKASPTSATVLICGESGTGKEIVARAIHKNSQRAKGPFVQVNCAAIPEELIESELFGHEKGAFTGAAERKIGKFELADKGTLFLDEIGDMSLKTQAKVLRVIQEKEFTRIGGERIIRSDVRIISATNKNLEEEIKKGNFRQDLLFRLNVIPIFIPPLRERLEDIPLLVEHFCTRFCSENGLRMKRFAPEVFEAFYRYHWPGNIRELRNLVERLVIMSKGDIITLKDLPSDLFKVESSVEKTDFLALKASSLKEAKELAEREFIIARLKANNYNIAKTARDLGIQRSNLYKKINYYKIRTSPTEQ